MSVYFIALTCLMVLVIFFDLTRYIIPNWLNAVIALLYIPMVLTTMHKVEWELALAATVIMFVIGYFIFRLRLMGGGDIKLFTVTALWVGLHLLAEYIMVVALLGGVLSLFLLITRKIAPLYYGRGEGKMPPKIMQPGAPVPYGLAIAAGFLFYLWRGMIAGTV